MSDSQPQLDYPYNKMLDALKDINGFYELKIRILRSKSDDWKAEVKALYEINKLTHPLIEICSHKIAEPEGIFQLNNGTVPGTKDISSKLQKQ